MNDSTALRLQPASLPPALPPAPLLEPEHRPLVREYLDLLLRWRFLILGVTLAFALGGVVVTFLMTPRFTASTTLEISRESSKITDIQGVERDASVADQEFYQTQYGLLRSASLAQRVAVALRLPDDPKFFALFRERSSRPAFALSNGQYSADGHAERVRTAGDLLLKNLTVAPTRLSRLVDVRFSSPDRSFSAKVANAWAANFIQVSLERRYQATAYARRFLESRLNQLRTKLETSERQLVSYAASEGIVNLPGGTTADGSRQPERSIAADNLTSLNDALAKATAERIDAEARFRQAGGDGANGGALANVAINNLRQRRAELAAEYQRLLVQFQPDYPNARAIQAQIAQLDKSITREENRVTTSVAADYRAAAARENALRTQVAALKGDILDLRRRSIQYNIYLREADTNRQLYDALLQRYKEIGVAGGIGVNNISVVDPAEAPEKPSSPRLLLNLTIALFAGLVAGIAAAFLLDQVDEAVADPSDIGRRLGLPLLGTIPRTTTEDPLDSLFDRKSEVSDAYLAVQANLELATDHGVPRSMAITSTRPREGKSTSSLALALTLARTNRRVILIDGDMRSPSLNIYAEVDNNRGLSNYLSGLEDVEGLIHARLPNGFDIMTAGPAPLNAAELLSSDRLARLIGELLQRYDHVIIDAPPVLGLADSLLISSRVDRVIYVVEARNSSVGLVRSALGRLNRGNVMVVGALLTKYKAKPGHYGYGYNYGYGYGQGEGARNSLTAR